MLGMPSRIYVYVLRADCHAEKTKPKMETHLQGQAPASRKQLRRFRTGCALTSDRRPDVDANTTAGKSGKAQTTDFGTIFRILNLSPDGWKSTRSQQHEAYTSFCSDDSKLKTES